MAEGVHVKRVHFFKCGVLYGSFVQWKWPFSIEGQKENIFSVHLDLLETSEVFVQTVGAGIPSAE